MISIQIVPRLPPSIDGLGDYAFLLAMQLRQEFGIHTHFLVADPTWVGSSELKGFSVSQVSDRTPSALHKLLSINQATSVFLHYVGYGYAKRGCPTWLIDGIQSWKDHTKGATLITMFHEVYAGGRPPWTSAFWLFPIQKQLAARLAKLSKSMLTSKQLYADILQNLTDSKHQSIPVLPIFSNVGEPENPPPLNKRLKRLVVFGGAANRSHVYKNAVLALSQACQVFDIKEIVDIGPTIGSMLTAIDDIPIVQMGKLAAPEISQILLQASVGFLDYNPDYLAKSGIFAAYCAYGMLPINATRGSKSLDGLVPRKHYWYLEQAHTKIESWSEMQAIADSAFAWYQTHCLSRHADLFAQALIN